MAAYMERAYSNGGSVSGTSSLGATSGEYIDRGRSPNSLDPSLQVHPLAPTRSYSPSRPPTSAEIDAVIAAAMANAPPHLIPPPEPVLEEGFTHRSGTPLMTNLLPAAVGADGRVNLFVGNLPYRVRWQDLKDLFRKAGTVLRSDVSLGPDNRSRGYGTVLMGSREDAARAIDRFNGYAWQTRVLEVRPDRLPPEYEAQPHIIHMPSHRPPPMYPYGNGNQPPYPMQGQGWQRQGMYGGLSPHPPPPNLAPSGSGRQSPPGGFGNLPIPVRDPIAGLNIAPSPLAGALTGNVPFPPNSSERRDSLAPSLQADHTGPIKRTASPDLPLSRPTSAADSSGASSALASDLERLNVMGARLSTSSGMKGISSPPEEFRAPAEARQSSAEVPHFPVNIDGLAHRGLGLGPPSNLHDRVVFVSNMPLSMQWQDLKDMLRPAGLIMRADVAQDENRKPRGYGTALFASETDAARAVQLFNGTEIGGRKIRVYLEKQSRNMLPGDNESHEHQAPSSPANRIPWGINTSIAQTPQRHSDASSPNGFPGGPTPGPNFRATHHPGPISMPPFAPMDSPNPLSPLQRGLPPMTPSMPGFIFNPAYPETPMHFLSPGNIPPFSPGIPVSSPTGFGYNPFLNAAPGAPVDRYNHFQGGSAALATPTTTAFPPGNHIHGYGGAPGGPPLSNGGTPNGNNQYANGGGEYFPFVPRQQNANDSPLRSRYPSGATMPLNARDRLASTEPTSQPSIEGEEGLMARLHRMDLTPSSPDETPDQTPSGTPGGGSPTVHLERRRAAARESGEGEEDTRGRYSLDGARPSGADLAGMRLGVGEGGERRASFGDAGR